MSIGHFAGKAKNWLPAGEGASGKRYSTGGVLGIFVDFIYHESDAHLATVRSYFPIFAAGILSVPI